MYHSFYNLIEKPFKIDTDPRFIWFGEQHREAMANLKYGLLDRNGFIVLTGDAGTGKTTLVNALLDTLDEKVRVVKINHPSLNTSEFLSLFAKTLDPSVVFSDKSDLLIFFNNYLQKAHDRGETALLIVDEAHRLSMELLEEIRLLSNIEMAGEKLLGIVLVGQNEIKPMLMDPQCRSLRQRITSIYDIHPLSEMETWEYIEYRLKVVGTTKPLFTTAAITQVHEISGGNPRLINTLCDRALLTGYVRESLSIDADIVSECGAELNLDRPIKAKKISTPFVDRLPSRHMMQQKIAAGPGWIKKAFATFVKGVQRFWRNGFVLGRHGWRACYQWLHGFNEKKLRHNNPKMRPKSASSVWVLGVTLSFVFMTVGMYSGVRQQDGPSSGPDELTEAAIHHKGLSLRETQTAPFSWKLTPRELAAIAKEEGNPLRIVEVPASHLINPVADKAEVAAREAKSFVGRAKALIAVSPAEAESLLLKAVEADSEQTEAYFMLAKKYIRDNDYPLAIEFYQHVVQIDPRASDAIFNLGFLYATTGEYGAAEKAFEQVLQLKPSYVDKTLFNLAVVQQKLGKHWASITNLETLVRMAPENEKAAAYLSQLKGPKPEDEIEFKR